MDIEHWNAGEVGCGALIVGLKRRLDGIAAGQILRVTAYGAGSRVDLPAWCRITGHTLVEADHPVYVLRKKVD
jgi:tRNA 2-thiouridine synthesizing protein A